MGASLDISQDKTALHYAAFISYAHSDERRAARLHRLLEGYSPPKDLKSRRHHLRPVFRDKAELTASHSLSEKIKDAVQNSRKLIVLCSPAAKNSHWVNEEIRLFRNVHGEAAILCALVEGTPDSSFPPALTEGGREPLAADLSGGHEGFRYGMLQLAASLLDVGLDDLVRRDVQHRRRAGSLAVIGALAFSGVMAASTYNALTAQRLAETNRAEAEGLVEYMITDLKTKLEPVGRLDILDGVGGKVMEYYGGQKIADMPYDRIARQARAQHLLGQVALDAGRYDEAKTQIDAAYALTKEVLARNPKDTDAIFAHAQSAFWVGKVFKDNGKLELTKPYWKEYHDLAYRLYDLDKTNFDWVMEAAWGEANMGIVNREIGRFSNAEKNYKAAIGLFNQALVIRPDDASIIQEIADSLTGHEQTALQMGLYSEAIGYNRQSLNLALELSKKFPNNKDFLAEMGTKQSNFLWQYNLFMTEQEREKFIELPWDTLKNLTQHDSDNIWWTRRYIWHLVLVLRHSVSTPEKEKAWADLSAAISVAKVGSISESIAFFIDEAKAQRLIVKGNIKGAEVLIGKMETDYSASSHQNISYNIVLSKLNYAVGNKEVASSFASAVITSFESAPSTYPESILHLAQAQVILGECKLAAETIASLASVPTGKTPLIKNIIDCRP